MSDELFISKTPMRVSFVGGGTDFEDFYNETEGAVVSVTIDKYVHVIVHKFFDKKILLKYSATELVDSVDDIKHPLIRECLKLTDIKDHLELTSFTDLSSAGGSGLGSSSAFTVGLLKVLGEYVHIIKDNETIAELACKVEIDKCGAPIGKQDQYACAIGGFNLIKFNKDGVEVKRLNLSEKTIQGLKDNLIMFNTGITRSANTILKVQKENIKDKRPTLIKMRNQAYKLASELEKGNFRYLGEALKKNWYLKKQLASGITSPEIDRYYDKAIELGAYSGKLIGAGGGGFFLFYCEKRNQQNLIDNLGLKQFKFEFDMEGTRVR